MRLIDADELIKSCQDEKGLYFSYEAAVTANAVNNAPTVDAVPVVRCKDCKHRIVNEHYGEKGYFKVKATCELDTGDIFSLGRCAEDDNWFCADGERKGGAEDAADN